MLSCGLIGVVYETSTAYLGEKRRLSRGKAPLISGKSTAYLGEKHRLSMREHRLPTLFLAEPNYPGIGKNLYLDINSHLHYNHSNNHLWGRSASFDTNPADDYIGATIDRLFSGDSISDLSTMLVNQREIRSISKGNTLDYGVEAYSSIKIPDFKPISLNMNYNATDVTL